LAVPCAVLSAPEVVKARGNPLEDSGHYNACFNFVSLNSRTS
jgi:hypothetical protein